MISTLVVYSVLSGVKIYLKSYIDRVISPIMAERNLIMENNPVFKQIISNLHTVSTYSVVAIIWFTIFISWLFYHSSIYHISILTFPGVRALIEMLQFFIESRKTLSSSDMSLVTFSILSISKIVYNVLHLIHFVVLFYSNGLSIASFLPALELYLIV